MPEVVRPAGEQGWAPLRAVATGRMGEWVRLKLAYGENAWVQQDSIKYLPAGTPIPKSSVNTILTKKLEGKTRIELLLYSNTGKLPFKMEQQTDPSALFLTVNSSCPDFPGNRIITSLSNASAMLRIACGQMGEMALPTVGWWLLWRALGYWLRNTGNP